MGFDLNTVHKLSIEEEKISAEPGFEPGLLGGKQKCFFCATQPQESILLNFSRSGAGGQVRAWAWATPRPPRCCRERSTIWPISTSSTSPSGTPTVLPW